MTNNFSRSLQEITQKEYCAREFLKIAKQDLIAAKVLYRNELYPEALFFLQQSIEKGYKAYHILSELGNGTENATNKNISIRKIGHTPTKITEKQASDAEERFLKIKNYIDSFPISDEIYEQIGINFSEIIQQFSNLKKIYSEISSKKKTSKKIRRHNLNDLIDELYLVMKKSNRFTQGIRNITFDDATKDKMKKEAQDLISPIIKISPEHAKKYSNMINDLFNENFHQIEPLLKILIQIRADSGCINVLYANLSIIIQTHESSTRYPGINRTPLKEYTRRHPIVLRFNSLTRLAETANKKFDNLLSSAENLQ